MSERTDIFEGYGEYDEPEFDYRRGHKFDRDSVCEYCRFDAAEWAWLRTTTPYYERDQSPMPTCDKTP